MHNVLDPRDLVPDEAQQLAHSGYPVRELLEQAAAAAKQGDLAELSHIANALGNLERSEEWDYVEPDEIMLPTLFETAPTLPYDLESYPDRVHGAWLGRAVGNTLGKPIEGLTRTEVELYLRACDQWPQTGYLPLLSELPAGVSHLHESAPFASAGRFVDVPRDDDIDWTILGLYLLETYGNTVTTEQVAAEWLDRLPFTQTFTAERAAYRNLIEGHIPPATATIRNPYREWIGALIRADIFGYVNPGNPAAAARLALVDARLSHTGNGIYGEVWAAALIAGAFSTTSARDALQIALQVVPARSRLAEAVGGVLTLFDQGVSHVAALDWVDQHLGHYNWVHTVNNAALISIGLLWGRDFMDAIAITNSGGRDTDSSSATVGSVYGALHGSAAIPPHLVGTTHVHVRSAVRDFDRVTITELAERTVRLAHVAPLVAEIQEVPA